MDHGRESVALNDIAASVTDYVHRLATPSVTKWKSVLRELASTAFMWTFTSVDLCVQMW